MMRNVMKTYWCYTNCSNQTFRTLFTSAAVFLPRNFTENLTPQITKTLDDDEVSTAIEIENNLFRGSQKRDKPVNSRELLQQFKKKPSPLKREKKVLIAKKENNVRKVSKILPKESSPIIKDTELDLEYAKLSSNDPILGKLILTARSRKYRDQNVQILVEGRRLILDALKSGIKMKTLLFSQKDQLSLIKDNVRDLKNVSILKVPPHNLNAWSSLTTCPGLLGIFERPKEVELLTKSKPFPITVVCDNIREPSNLGSIIRSCAALPCAQVVVIKGCCDPWESKALRGGCGGQFRVNIKDDVGWEDLENILPDVFSIFIAENNLNKFKIPELCPIIEYTEVEVTSAHNVLVIGGETHGISGEAYRFFDFHNLKGSCLHIPLAEGADSLNTAAALTLILFEMRKVFLEKQLKEDVVQEHFI